jgi:phosphoribosylpyrophosphate synthetase
MNRLKFIDRLRAAFRSRDEAALEKALEESLGGATAGTPSGPAVKTADASAPFADALEQLVERVKALEVSLATRDCRATKDEEEEEEEHEDQKKKGKDKKTGATSTELFQPRLRKSSSHPAHWDKRGDMELTGGPVPERLILVDDIATSGTTIEHAVQMLRAANPGMVILPVVWIYEDA